MAQWQIMWTFAVVIFFGCKWVTWRQVRSKNPGLDAIYFLAWPGLDAVSFYGPRIAHQASHSEWAFAWFKTLLGISILFGAARLVPASQPYFVGWIGMIGIAMTLHFGIFHVLSCAWRELGIVAKPLMNYPIAATSIGDFWGHRWNTAFRDLTHRLLFRPLVPKIGARWAMLVVFGFSGLVHDLVISVPAQGGYGLPTLYFLIQGLGIVGERRLKRKYYLTPFVTFLPALLVFHPPFVVKVVVPFLHAIGAV